MVRKVFILLMSFIVLSSYQKVENEDSKLIRKIFDEALVNGKSYSTLRSLCKDVGARLSGSPEADSAVRWGFQTLKSFGFDTVYLQKIMVPHWERGSVERAFVTNRNEAFELGLCALGGSVGTNGVITAEVVEVKSFEELANLGEEVIKGKIVFYNRPMNPRFISTFKSYSGCVDQRYAGASEAAKYGAVAAICRSMNLVEDEHPHTGSMGYKEGEAKIPAAALSTKSANILSNMLKKKGLSPTLSIEMDCITNPDKVSYNVIAETRGTVSPSKIIAFGGHLDSWDKGEGAHDDGAGIAHSIEALRLLKEVGYRSKYTLRCILFMNEENGNRGGHSYNMEVRKKGEKHIAALESDAGGFSPRGFNINGTDEEIAQIGKWRKILEPYGLHLFERGFAGVDIAPLKLAKNAADTTMLQLGLIPDSQRYFDYHHSDADVFEAVNQRELELGCASMASMIYLLDKYR